MSKIAIFLANGFEEIEGLTVVDICRRCGLTIDMVSITEDRQVMGSHKIPVTADMTLSQVDFTQYDCLVLPGGGLGTKNLEACEPLMQQVDAFTQQENTSRQSVRHRAYSGTEASYREKEPAPIPALKTIWKARQ